jgi:hypothetical protein
VLERAKTVRALDRAATAIGSNRNEYQKQKITFVGSIVRLTTLPPSMSRLSRQCGILNISQPYGPKRLDFSLCLLEAATGAMKGLRVILRQVTETRGSLNPENVRP